MAVSIGKQSINSEDYGGIEELCLLAKPLKGEGLKAIILKAIEDIHILGFGELINLPNVQEVRTILIPVLSVSLASETTNTCLYGTTCCSKLDERIS